MQHETPWFVSQTPCHLRIVRIAVEQQEAHHTTRCAACGRVWTLRINVDKTPPTATWTA